jgi:hypothetical protein
MFPMVRRLFIAASFATKAFVAIKSMSIAASLLTTLASRAMQSDYMTHTCAMLRHRPDQLGFKAWQVDVESKLFWTLLNRGVEEPGTALLSATGLLEKYEQQERISLLELAACIQK